MSENTSNLKLYSLGIVIEAKKRDSPFIKVYPVEELPMVNGKIADIKTTREVQGKDVNNNDKTIKAESDNIIIARWMPEQSNRSTAPDVQPSEHVLIWKFADTDEFFWSINKYEPNLRRLETVRYTFGDLKSGINEFDQDSSYWIEYSTHDKHVHLHTSKSDGEAFEYDVKIDTGKGIVTIKDDVGNYIAMDSTLGRITLKSNKEIVLKTEELVLDCDNLNIKSKSDIMVKCGGSSSETVAKDKAVTATSLGFGGGNAVIEGGLQVSGKIDATERIASGDYITSEKGMTTIRPQTIPYPEESFVTQPSRPVSPTIISVEEEPSI